MLRIKVVEVMNDISRIDPRHIYVPSSHDAEAGVQTERESAALRKVAEAARNAAAHDWGTSVSEHYHYRRMGDMDRLRAELAALKKLEEQ